MKIPWGYLCYKYSWDPIVCQHLWLWWWTKLNAITTDNDHVHREPGESTDNFRTMQEVVWWVHKGGTGPWVWGMRWGKLWERTLGKTHFQRTVPWGIFVFFDIAQSKVSYLLPLPMCLFKAQDLSLLPASILKNIWTY